MWKYKLPFLEQIMKDEKVIKKSETGGGLIVLSGSRLFCSQIGVV